MSKEDNDITSHLDMNNKHDRQGKRHGIHQPNIREKSLEERNKMNVGFANVSAEQAEDFCDALTKVKELAGINHDKNRAKKITFKELQNSLHYLAEKIKGVEQKLKAYIKVDEDDEDDDDDDFILPVKNVKRSAKDMKISDKITNKLLSGENKLSNEEINELLRP